MAIRWVGLCAAFAALAGCATGRGVGGSGGAAAPAQASSSSRYVDPNLGFEVTRPSSAWQLEASEEVTAEGTSIPVVLKHRESGAQVVLQVAPAVATPTQFAERLTHGLREHPGFNASDVEPLTWREGGVGFAFTMGDQVRGRVAILEGTAGRVLMVLATWPSGAPKSVADGVDQIFGSIRPLPPQT